MKLLALALAALVSVPAAPAAPFSDVPRTHWAYDAIQKAVDAGVLQGYDGKFEGARLLNRYQMAVVVAKLLDGMKAVPAGATSAPADVKKMVANLEALTIEFADELALLNVKVYTLEDSFQELRQQVAAGTGRRAAAPAAGGLGFTAFASFALLKTDDDSDNGCTEWDAVSGDTKLASDATYFDIHQLSLGIDKEVDPGVFFHAQVDFAAFINGGDRSVAVNEAWFFVDEMFGEIGGKVGGFALPFSMEHTGPFRTCDYTVTASYVNSMIEAARVYGIEFQKTKDVKPEDLFFKFGVVSGADGLDVYFPTPSSRPQALGRNTREFDGHLGFYVHLGMKPTPKTAFGWNVGYFDNGGDYAGKGSDEVDFYDVGLSWSNDDLLVMAQYMDGTLTSSGAPGEDFTVFYLLVNFKIGEKQSVSLRYDDADFDTDRTLDGITFAYNRKVSANSMLQFEYVAVDDNDAPDGSDLYEDDLIQVRYKVHF